MTDRYSGLAVTMTSGSTSSIVVSQRRCPASTSWASTVASIALASEPIAKESAAVTRELEPTRRSPFANTWMESEVITAAARAGDPEVSRARATISSPAPVAAQTGAKEMIARAAPKWAH